MKRIESFLNSGLYIFIIFTITMISWSFYKETPPFDFNLYNMMGVFLLILISTFILIFFENTLYLLPVLISFLFIINKSDMTFDTVSALGFPLTAFAIFVIGFIIHIIKFKPKFRQKRFYIGFFLIATAYLAPLIYIPFDIRSIPVSLMAVLYLLVYIFMSNTMKGNLNYLFKVMLFANLLLTAEVFFYIYQGYLRYPEMDFYHRIFQGWNRNLGWANINDMCFYISLTFPSYLYFIFKKPSTYLTWFLMIFPVIAVLLSKSRGGMVGFAVVTGGVFLFFLLKGNKKHLTHGLIFLVFTALLFYINREILYLWYEELIQSLGTDLNSFSSNRIYIYTEGLKIFKQYPLFGGGWISIYSFPFAGRIFMFHSTFIQALAAMGLYGLFALFVHYYQIGNFMIRKLNLEKSLFLIGYLATQIHGLIDNVQFSVPYSSLIVLFLATWETSELETSFTLVNHRYHIIET